MNELAYRYAYAFLQAFDYDIPYEHITAYAELALLLKKNRRIIFFLRLPLLTAEQKEAGLRMLFSQFGIDSQLTALVSLMQTHNHLPVLSEVLLCIKECYEERKHISYFDVSSAIPLNGQEQELIRRFAVAKIGGIVTTTFRTDASLIAGIRMQGRHYAGEWSIAKTLRQISKALRS